MTGKKVARIARNVLLRNSETKRCVVGNDVVGGFNTTALLLPYQAEFCNIFGDIPQNYTNYGVEGNEFVDPRVTFKFALEIDWGQTAVALGGRAAPIEVNVFIFAANDQYTPLTGSGFGGLTATQENAWFQQITPGRVVLEGQNLTVMKKKRFLVRPPEIAVGGGTAPNFAGYFDAMSFAVKARMKGKKEFEISNSTPNNPGDLTGNTSFLKGWNYYCLVHMGAMNVAPVTSGLPYGYRLYVDKYVYFKDP